MSLISKISFQRKILLILLFFIFSTSSLLKMQRGLVIIDDWNIITSHSKFFDMFEKISYSLEYKFVGDKTISLDFYGEKLYDSIILIIPSFTEEEAKNSEISIKKIIEHFDNGHNLMIFADEKVNSYIRSLVNEFGIDFDDYDSKVKDSFHLHTKKKELNPDLLKIHSDEIVISKGVTPLTNIFTVPKDFILYEGIGLETDIHNDFLFPILTADENSYSVGTVGENLFYNLGSRIKLVAGYQGRNNKRVVVSGSHSLCSNKLFGLSKVNDSPLSSNELFCFELIKWNLEKTGVLKYENANHKDSFGVTLDRYRISDDISYFIDILEYDYLSNSWKPYHTDDLQIEFTMMDPFYRLQLKILTINQPTYTVSFRLPEKWGVYKFHIDYKRVGYSYIDVTTKVPIRPYNHNEYERFLQRAFPYYISVFLTLIGFVIFTILFLFSSASLENKK